MGVQHTDEQTFNPKIRARLENPFREGVNKFTGAEREPLDPVLNAGGFQERKEFTFVTYEYCAPFRYENFNVELGDESKGAEYNRDGVELDVPPYGAITFVEREPIIAVSVIGSTCCEPGTVYLNCEPCEWKYPRSGLKFRRDGLWGEHTRAYAVQAGITEQYKKCGLFSADFNIPDSYKITIFGHGGFDMEFRDYETNHYDAHLTPRLIRVTVRRPL